MMKILYINYTKKDGGGIVHTLEFVKSVKNFGNDIIVYPTLEDKIRGNILQSTNDCSQTIHVGIMSSFLNKCYLFMEKYLLDLLFIKSVIIKGFLFNFLHELRKIKEVNPEIVVLRAGQFYSSIIICKILKIPLIVEVNGPIAEFKSRKIGQLRFEKFWGWLLEAKTLNLAGNIVVVSEPLRQYYIEMGLNPANIFTVPNGVDTNLFFPDNPRRNAILQKYGLNDSKIIGFTGNFRIWHGVEAFLDIFSKIVSENKYVKFLVVGDGPEREHLNSKVLDLELSKQIIFTGRINHEDMPAVLSVFDIAVAPYQPNDFFYFSPLKIFEYMAVGCVVIAPGLGQINDLIEDGISGVLYNVNKPDELISASVVY